MYIKFEIEEDQWALYSGVTEIMKREANEDKIITSYGEENLYGYLNFYSCNRHYVIRKKQIRTFTSITFRSHSEKISVSTQREFKILDDNGVEINHYKL